MVEKAVPVLLRLLTYTEGCAIFVHLLIEFVLNNFAVAVREDYNGYHTFQMTISKQIAS